MRHLSVLTAVIVLFCSLNPALGIEFEKPSYQVGDKWEYSVSTGKFMHSEEKIKVTKSDKNTIVTSLAKKFFGEQYQKHDLTTNIIRNLDFNPIDSDESTYSNEYQIFNWPLYIGKTWKFKNIITNKKTGLTVSNECESRIVSNDKLELLNRVFDTLIIEDKCTQKVDDKIHNFEFKRWYSPDIKNIVYQESFNKKSSEGFTVKKLIAFSLE